MAPIRDQNMYFLSWHHRHLLLRWWTGAQKKPWQKQRKLHNEGEGQIGSASVAYNYNGDDCSSLRTTAQTKTSYLKIIKVQDW